MCLPLFGGAKASVQTPDSLSVNQLLDSAYELEGTNGDAALKVYAEALRQSKRIGYGTGEAKSLHYSGIVYSDKSMYRESLQKYREALAVYSKIRNTRGVGACYTNIGNLFRFQSKFDSALIYYQKALQILLEHSHHDALSQAYGNAGGMFQQMKQYQKAYEYHSQSVKFAIESNDSLVLCRALINQGTVLNDLKRPDESVAAQKRALAIAQRIDDDYGIQLANINLADHYKQLKEYEKAIQFGLQSLHYALKLATPYDIADIKKRVGDLYAATGEYHKARAFYTDAIDLAEGIKASEIALTAYVALNKTFAQLGDYEQAYKYQSLAQQYQDSILGEKQMKIVNELEVKYQTVQKDKELAQQQLNLQKSKQYTVYSIGAALILLLSILLLYFHYNNRKKNHQRQLQTIQRENEIHVLQALMQGEEKERARIARDLHDEVAGILAATKMHLESLALHREHVSQDRSYNQAVNLLDEASSSVRKTAHNLMPEILMQFGLDKAVQRYCASIGNAKQLVIQYDSWGNFNRCTPNFELSVYRIVQELLNNILKHARATEVLVQLSCQDNVLSITVEDNGIGFSAHNAYTKEGMGLNSLRTRVQALNGRMDITSEDGAGVSTYLEFDTKDHVYEANDPSQSLPNNSVSSLNP